jgi:hypothetical protein
MYIYTYILQGMSNFGPQIKKRTWKIRVYFHVSGSEFDFLMELTCFAIFMFSSLIIQFGPGLVRFRRLFCPQVQDLGLYRCETSCETQTRDRQVAKFG